MELLGRAPDPDRAAALSQSQIAAALRRAKRRDVEVMAAHLRQPGPGAGRLRGDRNRPGAAHRHGHAGIEQHGLGMALGARILGELGDDPKRFADANDRKNYAGTSQIIRASGTRRVALAARPGRPR